jgi:hypothetical protein
MNILLVGGSNTGISYGWGAQFRAMARGHVVTNRFLGAVGSLFGLLRLLELEREGAPLPDLVVFEYGLNDMMLLDSGCVTRPLLRATLLDVIDFCARRGIRLVLLCLEVRPTERARVHACVERVKSLYREVARAHETRCLTLDEMRGAVRYEDYSDEHHLTPEASRDVARWLMVEIDLGRIEAPSAPPAHEPTLFYAHAETAAPIGPCRLTDIESTVFSGRFLEIARGGASRWPGRGRLVALMLRSTQTAGVFEIRAGPRSLRKNAQSQMRSAVPRLMLLHYLTRPLVCLDDLVISMPAAQAPLMALREDRTPLSTTPPAPFAEQQLEIHGVMFWRRPSLAARMAAALRPRAPGRDVRPRRHIQRPSS